MYNWQEDDSAVELKDFIIYSGRVRQGSVNSFIGVSILIQITEVSDGANSFLLLV
jgi:hypothetical protein